MRFYIETYGCQMNIADSELVTTILRNNGYQEATTIDDADIIIFNTCSVRQHAEERVLGRIANEKSRKRTKPSLKIGVIGCMAQRLQEELMEIQDGIDFVVGVDQYSEIPHIINSKSEHLAADFNKLENYNDIYPTRQGKLNAFVTIMRGCNNFCSYCIVPYTRGRERSRPISDILTEVRQAGENGFPDITLLGQNVNSYEFEGIKFPDLIREINKIDSIKRIRFVTSHPKDLSDDLIIAMSESDKVCHNIHFAMQSGNTEILARMNRGYTAEHFYGRILKLREVMPDIAITTDVIAGFAGESEEQFMDTYNLMKKIEFDYAFMYKYSPRRGTKAAEFTDQVPEAIRLDRLQRLIEMQRKITFDKYQNQIGKVVEVLVENLSKKSDEEVSGKTSDFKICVFPGSQDLIGKFVKVKITDATAGTLIGEKYEQD
jgi:tRNA-2-methylthio-N6-dimethylallyladenosine synthase